MIIMMMMPFSVTLGESDVTANELSMIRITCEKGESYDDSLSLFFIGINYPLYSCS